MHNAGEGAPLQSEPLFARLGQRDLVLTLLSFLIRSWLVTIADFPSEWIAQLRSAGPAQKRRFRALGQHFARGAKPITVERLAFLCFRPVSGFCKFPMQFEAVEEAGFAS